MPINNNTHMPTNNKLRCDNVNKICVVVVTEREVKLPLIGA
jgi:hypothetical protein